jgi:ComF family protein
MAGVVVVPVPLHPSRLADRGFNQAALIASRLARRLEATFRPLALARVRDTPRQASLDREARLANMARALVARRPEQVFGRDVLLVDDVRTTGATIDACTDALLAAGARSVSSATVASAPRD